MNGSDAEKIKEYYTEWWKNPKDIRNVVFDSLNELVRENTAGLPGWSISC